MTQKQTRNVYRPAAPKFGAISLASLVLLGTISSFGLASGHAAKPEPRPIVQANNPRPPYPPAQVTAKSPTAARKPAKIKLHRGSKGDYTWDITGDNAEEILRIDRRLQKAFDPQGEH